MLFKNLLRVINGQKNNIFYIVFILFIFAVGLFTGRQFSTYQSDGVLQTTRQELERARNENQRLTDQLNRVRSSITRSRNEARDAGNLVKDSQAILRNLISTIQEISNILENSDGSNSNTN